jgi:transketolase
MRATALNKIYELAKRDERVVFIGSDLRPNLLGEMKKEFPDRFFMIGVSEQFMIGFAAGLAMEGFIPYLNTIGPFMTERCYEQISVDLCLHNLPVRLIASGGGYVYSKLGPTHQNIKDIAIMRALPNMTVCAPADAHEMAMLMDATLDFPHPMYIRLAKGGDRIITKGSIGSLKQGVTLTKLETEEEHDVLLIGTGIGSRLALDTSEILEKENIECCVIHHCFLKPFDSKAIYRIANKGTLLIVTVEEHTINGGLGSIIAEIIAEKLIRQFRFSADFMRIGIPDCFSEDYGTQESLLSNVGLDPQQIADKIKLRLTN